MSGLTIDELIEGLREQRRRLGGDAPAVIMHRLSGWGTRGCVEYRPVEFMVPMLPDAAGRQALILRDSSRPYRVFVGHQEVKP